jgi:hypothetical protein
MTDIKKQYFQINNKKIKIYGLLQKIKHIKPILLNIDDLKFSMRNYCWRTKEKKLCKPIDIITNPTDEDYKSHYKRIVEADLSYPILITTKYNIIDGIHRVIKCIITGKTYIYCIVVPNKILQKESY